MCVYWARCGAAAVLMTGWCERRRRGLSTEDGGDGKSELHLWNSLCSIVGKPRLLTFGVLELTPFFEQIKKRNSYLPRAMHDDPHWHMVVMCRGICWQRSNVVVMVMVAMGYLSLASLCCVDVGHVSSSWCVKVEGKHLLRCGDQGCRFISHSAVLNIRWHGTGPPLRSADLIFAFMKLGYRGTHTLLPFKTFITSCAVDGYLVLSLGPFPLIQIPIRRAFAKSRTLEQLWILSVTSKPKIYWAERYEGSCVPGQDCSFQIRKYRTK